MLVCKYKIKHFSFAKNIINCCKQDAIYEALIVGNVNSGSTIP